MDQVQWEVFVSYASEDREPVAAPLAGCLAGLGLRVWFDQFELKVGDSLRERIDGGLTNSRYGIVILSKSFFSKRWPTRELNGLVQRESDGKKVILPVWHDVDEHEVRAFSPILADRIGLRVAAGVPIVAIDLLQEIAPEVAQSLHKRSQALVHLKPIQSGQELAGIVGGAHMFNFVNQGAETREQSDEVAGFLQELQDWGDIWNDLEVGEHVKAEFDMHQSLIALLQAGWTVHAATVKRKIQTGGEPMPVVVAAVAVVKGTPPFVFLDGDRFFIPHR
jgi:hypothetical protein